jgi:hypothetical protein
VLPFYVIKQLIPAKKLELIMILKGTMSRKRKNPFASRMQRPGLVLEKGDDSVKILDPRRSRGA